MLVSLYAVAEPFQKTICQVFENLKKKNQENVRDRIKDLSKILKGWQHLTSKSRFKDFLRQSKNNDVTNSVLLFCFEFSCFMQQEKHT